MNYTSLTKEIARTHANVKYWAVANSRNRCDELTANIKANIAKLNEMLTSLIKASACAAEKDEAVKIRREIEAISLAI